MILPAIVASLFAIIADGFGSANRSVSEAIKNWKMQVRKGVGSSKNHPLWKWPFEILVEGRGTPESKAMFQELGIDVNYAVAIVFNGKPLKTASPTYIWRSVEEGGEYIELPEDDPRAPFLVTCTSGKDEQVSEDIQSKLDTMGILLVEDPLADVPLWLDWDVEMDHEQFLEETDPDFHKKLENDEWDGPCFMNNTVDIELFILDLLTRGFSFAILFDDYHVGYYRTYFIYPLPRSIWLSETSEDVRLENNARAEEIKHRRDEHRIGDSLPSSITKWLRGFKE